jgi:lantibiotic modifying enzyme
VTAFAGTQIRAVLRPTKAYGDLLLAASHPEALGDELDRERVLDAVWRGARRRPDLGRVAAAELHDVAVGDVPKFTTTPGSADLHHHAHGTLAGVLAPQRAFDVGDLARLDAADRDRQVAFLRAAMAGAAPPAAPRPCRPASGRSPAPAVLLEAARRLGERLELLALTAPDGRRGWLAPTPLKGRGHVLQAAGPSWAHGDAGIEWFLAALDDPPADLARRLRTLVRVEAADALPDDTLATGELGLALVHGPQRLADVLRAAARDGWRCGVPGVESPRLADGLAGIGAGLLALAL